MSTSWYDHVLFALLGVIIPLMSIQSRVYQDVNELELDLPPKKHVYLNNFFILCIGMLLCLTAWHAGNNDWTLFGFQKMEYSQTAVWVTFLLIFLYAADGIISYFKVRGDSEYYKQMKDIIPLTWREYLSFIPLAFMAGISEEIIYRAYLYHYLLTYFETFSYGSYIAILITSLGFSLGHLYQGWYAIIKIYIISVLFGIVYIETNSLLGVIGIHILIDLISGMSGIWLLKKLGKDIPT